jgi:hypothetical protein
MVTVTDGDGTVVFPDGPMTHPAVRIAPIQIRPANAGNRNRKVEFI